MAAISRLLRLLDGLLTGRQTNGIKLSCGVIASGAKQSLFSAEIASSRALLAMTGIP
jgi:hypothetical protein